MGDTVTDIYMSDQDTMQFDLSLPSVVTNYDIEMLQVGSLPGLYIANAYVFNPETGKDEIVTLVTYNYGSIWFSFNPPPGYTCPNYDNPGEFYSNCTLNLNAPNLISPLTAYGSYQGILTQNTSIGLILSSGQVGPGLYASAPNELYISADAGLTWNAIFSQGLYQYDSTNHGSVILVMGQNDSNYISYSTNYGKNWNTCDLPQPYTQLHGIYNQLSESNQNFFVLTSDPTSPSKVIYLDFTSSLQRECSQEDFQEFSPHSPQGENCLFGKSYTVTRRNPVAECWVPLDYVSVENVTTCNCTVSDFMCTNCYEREPFSYDSIGTSRYCVWYCSSLNPNPVPPNCSLPEGDPNKIDHYLTKNSPYRKNTASTCQGGVNLVNDSALFYIGCSSSASDTVNPPTSIIPQLARNNSTGKVTIGVIVSILGVFLLMSGIFFIYHYVSKKIKIAKSMQYGPQKNDPESPRTG